MAPRKIENPAKEYAVRRHGVCKTIPAPRPAMRHEGGALLRILPSGGQDQTRTHRLSHRSALIHRRGVRPADKATPRRHLPVLWRADEKIMEAATPMASGPHQDREGQTQPRATTAETSLHMIHGCDHLSIRDGTFRSYGKGLGELRPARGNHRFFTLSNASLAASLLGNRVVSTRNTAKHGVFYQLAGRSQPAAAASTNKAANTKRIPFR